MVGRTVERRHARRDGFTLIELLTVLAIIGTIPSLMLPAIQQQRAKDNQLSAKGSVEQIFNAEATFRTTDADGDLIDDYGSLGSLGALGLLSPLIASGTKDGYAFSVATSVVPSYVALAIPQSPKTGVLRFYVDQTGVLRFSATGTPGPASPPLPIGGESDTPLTVERAHCLDMFGVSAIQSIALADELGGGANVVAAIDLVQAGEVVDALVLALDANGDGMLATGEWLEVDLLSVAQFVAAALGGDPGPALGADSDLRAILEAYQSDLGSELLLALDAPQPDVALASLIGGDAVVAAFLQGSSAPVPGLGSGHAAVTIGLLLLAVLASTVITRRRRAAALSRTAVAALLCAAGLAGIANSSSACGDVDVDGDVSVSDVAAFRLFLANPEGSPLTDAGFAQCTVHGRARPCDVLDLVVLRRSIALEPDQPPLGVGCEDGDLDGVDDDADQCPETPPGAPTLAAAAGCSPLDVISRPESLTEPAADALMAGIDILASPDFASYPELADLLSVAQGSLPEMDLAVSNLRAGSLCAGAGAYRAMVDLLESRRGVVEDGWQVLQLRIQTAGAAPPVGADGSQHFGDGHIDAMVLSLAIQELDEGIARAQTAAGAFDASCSSVTGPVSVSGRVARIDDALQVVELEGGGSYALTSGTARGPFTSGQIIDLSGTGLGAGIGIATEVTGDELISGTPGTLGVDCLSLRVAPLQAFAPFVMSPPTYHTLMSYETSEGVVELENGMRFATVAGSCPGANPFPTYVRYTMRITINGLPVADELLPSDPPALIPANIPRNLALAMDVAVQRQVCTFAPGNDPCGPITDLRTETHTVRIRGNGSYCGSDYADRTFDLEDNDFVGFATTRVDTTFLDPLVVPASTGPVFRAESCIAISGATSCSNGTIVATYQDQDFRLYSHDFYPLYGPSNWYHHYQSQQKYGVTTASGLRWPRVQGTRLTRPFWYSCGIPAVNRDVVDFCPSPPHSYYRYPLYPGGTSDPANWTVALGNGTSPPGHGGDQYYAWDITAELGSTILAARPGRVTQLRESSTDFSSTIDGLIESDVCYNRLAICFDSLGTGTCASSSECTAPKHCQSGTCISNAEVAICAGFYPCDLGNYLWVRHQDGTFGIYFHMRQNGVLVQPGDIVRRSNPIGEVGDTGNSSQEHLHFQSHSIPNAFSVLSVFQQSIEVAAPDNICHLPLNGERLPSSNHPNDFY